MAKSAIAAQKRKTETGSQVIQSDQRKGAEAPKYKSVGDAGKRALANDLTLQQHFPDELANARTERLELEIGIVPGTADGIHRFAETEPEKRSGDA